MIGMQDKNPVHRARHDRDELVSLARYRKHHMQEIVGISQIVARINEWLADGVFVGHGGDGRHLGDEPVGGDLALLGVGDVGAVMIERAQRSYHAHHHGHGVSVAPETTVKGKHLFIEHGVVGDDILETGLLNGVWQFAVEKQVAHLEEIAMLGEVLDRVAAMQQHPLLAVDEGDP